MAPSQIKIRVEENGRDNLSLHRGQVCVTPGQTKRTANRMALWRKLALCRSPTASNFYPPAGEPS